MLIQRRCLEFNTAIKPSRDASWKNAKPGPPTCPLGQVLACP
jgi:hypothetical protein